MQCFIILKLNLLKNIPKGMFKGKGWVLIITFGLTCLILLRQIWYVCHPWVYKYIDMLSSYLLLHTSSLVWRAGGIARLFYYMYTCRFTVFNHLNQCINCVYGWSDCCEKWYRFRSPKKLQIQGVAFLLFMNCVRVSFQSPICLKCFTLSYT